MTDKDLTPGGRPAVSGSRKDAVATPSRVVEVVHSERALPPVPCPHLVPHGEGGGPGSRVRDLPPSNGRVVHVRYLHESQDPVVPGRDVERTPKVPRHLIPSSSSPDGVVAKDVDLEAPCLKERRGRRHRLVPGRSCRHVLTRRATASGEDKIGRAHD